MTWRIHLTNQAIQHLYIMPGKPPVLAVWVRKRHVYFYDLPHGTRLDERTLPRPPRAPRSSEAWQAYLDTLKPPDETHYLPHVPLGSMDIYSTDDGKLRLYRTSKGLHLAIDHTEDRLPIIDARRFVALDIDRALGTIVALDETGRLHIYRQNLRIGAFDIGLNSDRMLRPAVVVVEGSGHVQHTLDVHYDIGRMTCSPGGGMVLTADRQSGVLRAYQGDSLILTHQKFAIDLVADATQKQLMADLPPMGTAISAMTAYSRGRLVFAMSGVVCATDVTRMDEVPRPKALP
jgi:hypothetical protein